ncbi:MAG TPA: hypothetical protein VHX39_19970 [Acetobacteraceae bacterium]|jgi:hypothetical protein|nr:hypothetical protein [Acetobacteraceae bacterium]
MRIVLIAGLVLGAASMSLVRTANAADPNWHKPFLVEGQNHTAFQEPDQQNPDWLQEPCLNDRHGNEICRHQSAPE